MIELDFFKREDFKILIDWMDTPELLQQWGGSGFTFPLTEEQLEKYINLKNVIPYKVVNKEDGNIIGHISLCNIDKRNNSVRIGTVLVGDKDSRGKGIGEEMINEIMKIAFEEFKFHRVDLVVYDFNESAIRCYEKAGFKIEGLMKECRRFKDEYWSLFIMAILKSEWENNYI